MKGKIKLCWLMLFISVAVVFAGCGNKDTAKVADKNVNLKWAFIGPAKQRDADQVWDQFNEKLNKVMPNTEIEFEQIAQSDYQQKWALMSAAAEPVDLVWTGFANPIIEQAQKGSIIALDDLLKNTPELKNELPDWVWEKATYNGKIYGVPNYQSMVEMRVGLYTHKEFADEYMNKDKIMGAYQEGDDITQKFYDSVAEYLEKLKQNGKLYKGLSPEIFTQVTLKGREPITGPVYIKKNEDGYKVYSDVDDDIKLLHAKNMRDWFKKGYIRQDIVGLQNTREDEGKKDGYTLYVHEYYKDTADMTTLRRGYPIDVIPLDSQYYIGSQPPATNTSISSTSKNQETAIKFLELINTEKGKDLYNLLVYGIENDHYKKTSDNKIETLDYAMQADSNSKYGLFKWAMGNTFNAWDTQSDSTGRADYIKNDVMANAQKSKILGFKFDTTPVKVELAQLSAVDKEFKSLSFGISDDYESMVNARKEKMKKAGLDKVVNEVQKQLDEWVGKNR